MIISASRRTDIPAFYSKWFMTRMQDGFVDVINPFNRKQVSRVSLKPEDVDCIVFWTKDAAHMLPFLNEMRNYHYYFQFTITPYGTDVEPGLRPKKDIIRTFQQLSEKLGKERVVWRYDPILLSSKHTIVWHQEQFRRMLHDLAPYTDCCVISFLDLYKKTVSNTTCLNLQEIIVADMNEIARSFAEIAKGSGVSIQSCSEEVELDVYGIQHGACIDKHRIEIAMGHRVNIKKDLTQRQICGCMKSVDIGQYNTCLHFCRYCYANFNQKMAITCMNDHDDNSTILTGHLHGDEKITPRKVEHVKILSEYEDTKPLF